MELSKNLLKLYKKYKGKNASYHVEGVLKLKYSLVVMYYKEEGVEQNYKEAIN